jgi:hypothetical protein
MNVPLEFAGPEFNPGLRQIRESAPDMSVPETPMNQKNRPMARENYIRPAWKFAAVKPKPKAHPVQGTANGQFGDSVSRPDLRHVGAALWVNIGQHFWGGVHEPSIAAARSRWPLILDVKLSISAAIVAPVEFHPNPVGAVHCGGLPVAWPGIPSPTSSFPWGCLDRPNHVYVATVWSFRKAGEGGEGLATSASVEFSISSAVSLLVSVASWKA